MPSARPILLVTRNFPPARGGIETMAFELVKQGVAEGRKLAVLHVGQNPRHRPPEGLVAYKHVAGTGRWSALLASLFWIPLLALRLRAGLVVNMQVTTAPGSLLARLLLRTPYMVLGMGLELLPGGIPPWRMVRGLALRGARKVISISRFTDSLLVAFGVPPDRRAVINPGTRLFPDLVPRPKADLFGAGAENRFVLLSISRLVPRKGVDKAIEATALVAKERPEVLLCVGGSGPDSDRLKNLASQLGMGEHVRFLGRVSEADMGPAYAAADLFVLPSRTSIDPPDAEGFGIVFLEAGACGTPSLGGDSGGVPDAVRDGETGLLAPPEDARALADRILRLMGDAELLRRLGVNAKAHAEDSTWPKAAGRYFAAFEGGLQK